MPSVRQQAITWANVDPDLCRQMASLCLNELIQQRQNNATQLYTCCMGYFLSRQAQMRPPVILNNVPCAPCKTKLVDEVDCYPWRYPNIYELTGHFYLISLEGLSVNSAWLHPRKLRHLHTQMTWKCLISWRLGFVVHIGSENWFNICVDNGLSPVQHLAMFKSDFDMGPRRKYFALLPPDGTYLQCFRNTVNIVDIIYSNIQCRFYQVISTSTTTSVATQPASVAYG